MLIVSVNASSRFGFGSGTRTRLTRMSSPAASLHTQNNIKKLSSGQACSTNERRRTSDLTYKNIPSNKLSTALVDSKIYESSKETRAMQEKKDDPHV